MRRRRFLIKSALFIGAAALAGALLVGRCRRHFPPHTVYDHLIREAALRHRISPFLVKGVIKQESNFRPWSVGNAGEVGLMQITRGAVTDWERATGRRCPFQGMLFDPRMNIEIGTWYLGRAVHRWQDHGEDAEILALAEYNAGFSNARKWAPEMEPGNALDQVRFPSTRQYIMNVLMYREHFQQGSSSGEGPKQLQN